MAGLVIGHAFAACNLEVTVSVRCGVCQAQAAAVERVPHLAGQELEWGAVPVGWQVVNGQAVCPMHQVSVGTLPSATGEGPA